MRNVKFLSIIFLTFVLAYILWAYSEVGKYQEKLWAHRCNTIEKWESANNLYPNAEVDVVFRDYGIFDITHDPETSFGLSLDEYFKQISLHSNRLWLDMKNLTPETAVFAVNQLDSLCNTHKISKSQLIVESSCEEALQVFTSEGGYYTSYYIPVDEDPSIFNEMEITNLISKLQQIIDAKKIKAISFPIEWYDIMHTHINRNIDLLTWSHKTSQWTFMLIPKYRKILNDKQVKVILVNRRSFYKL